MGKRDKTPEEELTLIKLANELNSLHVSRTHPNPYFEQFATAMANTLPTQETVLTKEEIKSQTKLADEVLAEILAEDASEEDSAQ